MYFVIFCFNQNTAYEMRISDWSSGVCSSDLHVTRMEVVNNRVTAVPIETRGAIGVYDRAKEHYTLICSTQNIHANRNELAEQVLGIPKEKMRQVAYDVGGGFGRSEEHTSELQSLMRISYAVFCLKKKKNTKKHEKPSHDRAR